MMRQLKTWWAKKADYEKRRLFRVGGFVFTILVIGLIAFAPASFTISQSGASNIEGLWDEDKTSLLIFGGLFLFSLLIIVLFPAQGRSAIWDKEIRRARLATKRPWVKKRF